MRGRLAHWAGWPGSGRNPLRRRIDRVETAARLMVGAAMLTAVPAAGLTAGQFAENLAVRQARTQAAAALVIGDVFAAVTLAMLAAAFALLATMALIHRILQRRRMNAWDAEWRAVAPRWTGYRT